MKFILLLAIFFHFRDLISSWIEKKIKWSEISAKWCWSKWKRKENKRFELGHNIIEFHGTWTYLIHQRNVHYLTSSDVWNCMFFVPFICIPWKISINKIQVDCILEHLFMSWPGIIEGQFICIYIGHFMTHALHMHKRLRCSMTQSVMWTKDRFFIDYLSMTLQFLILGE